MSVKGSNHILCNFCRVKYATFHDSFKLCDGCYVKDNPDLPENIRKYLLDRDGRTPKLDIEFTPKRWSKPLPRNKQCKHKEPNGTEEK